MTILPGEDMGIQAATKIVAARRFRDIPKGHRGRKERQEFGRAKAVLRKAGLLHSHFPRRFAWGRR